MYGLQPNRLRGRVAVEDGIEDLDAVPFAAQVSGTLADPRSWTGAGVWTTVGYGVDL